LHNNQELLEYFQLCNIILVLSICWVVDHLILLSQFSG